MHLMYCCRSVFGTPACLLSRQHLPDLWADCVHHLPVQPALDLVPSVDLAIVEVGQVKDPVSAAPAAVAVVGTEPRYGGEQQAEGDRGGVEAEPRPDAEQGWGSRHQKRTISLSLRRSLFAVLPTYIRCTYRTMCLFSFMNNLVRKILFLQIYRKQCHSRTITSSTVLKTLLRHLAGWLAG